MSNVKGLFIEGDYVLTEMDYAGVGLRRLYFRKGSFKSTEGIPEQTLDGHDASVTADAGLRYGPGAEYDDFDGETLGTGTPLSVFFEENGWVFMEFMSAQWLDRGWVPAEFVVPGDSSHVTAIIPTATPRPTATRRLVTEEVPPDDVLPLSVSAWMSNTTVDGQCILSVRATVQGGTGDYAYRYELYANFELTYSSGRWSTNNTWEIRRPPGHIYRFKVMVRDDENSVSVFTNSINTSW